MVDFNKNIYPQIKHDLTFEELEKNYTLSEVSGKLTTI